MKLIPEHLERPYYHRIFFNNCDPIFESWNTRVKFEVASLAGTQLCFQLAKENKLKFLGHGGRRVDFSISRSDKLRITSAYNKKVIGCDSVAKYLLIRSSGLERNINFSKYLGILKQRQDQGAFIDRHFRIYQRPNTYNLDQQKSVIENLLGFEIPDKKIKSSTSIVGSKAVTVENMSPDDVNLLEIYVEEQVRNEN